jgi:predicted RNA binding protein YcfA (HicA-like mRNA interferase family)
LAAIILTFDQNFISGGIHMVFREVDSILRKNGWYVVRIKGSHHQYAHSNYGHCVTATNHGSKDLSLLVLKNLQKGTGLSFRR